MMTLDNTVRAILMVCAFYVAFSMGEAWSSKAWERWVTRPRKLVRKARPFSRAHDIRQA